MASLPLHIVTDMHFAADDATVGELAYRLRSIINEVGLELSKVAGMVRQKRAASELTRAAALLLQSESCLDRLDAIERIGAARPDDAREAA